MDPPWEKGKGQGEILDRDGNVIDGGVDYRIKMPENPPVNPDSINPN